jgi:hypothetical protein
MEVEFSAVPTDQVLPLWNRVAPLFQKLIDREGRGSLEDIFKKLAIDKTDLLWIAWEKNNLDNILMVVITRLYRDHSLELLACSGKKRYLWMNYFSILDKFAKDNNCKTIKIKNGRKGWKRELEKQGMKITGYTFEKSM